MLRHTQCRVLVAAQDQRAEVAGLDAELPGLDHVVIRDEGYEDWLASFPATDPDPAIGLEDFYVIRHSAGGPRVGGT